MRLFRRRSSDPCPRLVSLSPLRPDHEDSYTNLQPCIGEKTTLKDSGDDAKSLDGLQDNVRDGSKDPPPNTPVVTRGQDVPLTPVRRAPLPPPCSPPPPKEVYII